MQNEVERAGCELTDLRLTLHRNGYWPVPTVGKKALLEKWPTICRTADEKDIKEWTDLYRSSTNTGILCGRVVGIDIDVVDEALSNAVEGLARSLLGDSPLKRIGSAPKMLLLYRAEAPFGKKETPELFLAGQKNQVEVLAERQQFVAFGIHPGTGKEYVWPSQTPITVRAEDLPRVTETQCADFIERAERLLREAGATAKSKSDSKPKTRSPPGDINSAALANLSAWVPILFPEAKLQPGTGAYRVSSSALGRDLEEDLSFHPDGIRDFGREEGLTAIEAVVRFGAAETPSDAAAKLSELLALDDFVRDPKGLIVANSLQNVRTAVTKLGVTLSHDRFQDRLLINGLADCGPLLDDRAMERLWLTVDERFGFRPSHEFFYIVVADVARRNSFHPVRDYLAGLSWDGASRVDRWLELYGGAEDSSYVRAVGALALIAAVRRVRQPGCKFDELLVLESEQGTNKSSALAILAVNDDWFSDDVPLNAEGKRVIEALSGRWILEAAELKGMRKGEIEHLKAFLSRRIDRSRMSYDRLVTEVPRECIIVGTTNSERYLRDSTGNRRFWPVPIKSFDLGALRRDRDQLWAEAAKREADGESIRLDPKLYEVAADAQGARLIDDPYTDHITQALEGLNGKILAADAWTLIGKPPGQRTQENNARFGEAMRLNGWERTKARIDGRTSWVYARGTAEERKKRIVVDVDEANHHPYARIMDELPEGEMPQGEMPM